MTATLRPTRRAQPPAPTPSRRGRRKPGTSRTPASWVVLVCVGAFSIVVVLPVLLAAMNAVKSSAEYTSGGPLAFPRGFDLTNLAGFWQSIDFTGKLINSVLISVGATVVAVVLSLLTAYGIGIGRVRGRFWMLAMFMVAFTLPQEALIYPLYVMSKALGLYDSPWAVVVIVGVLQSAFGIYLLASVMGDFPQEILEAAKLDGAGSLRTLISVVIPLMRPTIGVLATFFFIWTWNEFFISLVLLPSAKNQTVSVALGALFGQYTSSPVTTAAAATVGILPALVFFIIFQRTLMRGINLGAVK